MATLKEIEMRLKGTRNIKKITTSMKMVSAAKYAQAERRLKPARTYGAGAVDVYDKTGAEGPEAVTKQLIIAISSDRGGWVCVSVEFVHGGRSVKQQRFCSIRMFIIT